MLVDAYGSDNSDNSGDESITQSRSSLEQKKSTSLSLPPPHSSLSGTFNLALPAPKAKKPPKKIAIDLPALPKDDSADHDSDEARPSKKLRTENTRGAGSSALFSRLPAPMLAAPVKPAPERVLGSGQGPGLVFKKFPSQKPQDTPDTPSNVGPEASLDAMENERSLSLPFMPASVRRGTANVSLEESSSKGTVNPLDSSPSAVMDLFSLNSSKPPAAISGSRSVPSSLSISSAPEVEEYTAPEPTPNDPYPGYYQLPSGTWAAYNPTYYQKFYDKWKADYDREVRALEKKAKGFEDADAHDTQEINALHEMEKAKKEIQEREEKKALTQGAGGEPAAPRMNIKGSKVSKGARKRGQLASLLVEAYQNREVLEEKIAEGRRNRKEAGNKYGTIRAITMRVIVDNSVAESSSSPSWKLPSIAALIFLLGPFQQAIS
ncbi:mitotic checkpoint regulator, MAD2B-interacting-domain-containing protein [Russula earlei]|uniref:Mitotic checkpoint regulator, MAD2B-interacting-domain-containing protein n=1 Tax=Russula earlei TaxID=71964 RepID=A0ACC0UD15_9AGAM|nr:mitotic checkpoint regulator, MAD2B-interacting-domain-containing protein [Russula earlei]